MLEQEPDYLLSKKNSIMSIYAESIMMEMIKMRIIKFIKLLALS